MATPAGGAAGLVSASAGLVGAGKGADASQAQNPASSRAATPGEVREVLAFVRATARSMDARPPPRVRKMERRLFECGGLEERVLGKACEARGAEVLKARAMQLATAIQQASRDEKAQQGRSTRHGTRPPWSAGWDDENVDARKAPSAVFGTPTVNRRSSFGLWSPGGAVPTRRGDGMLWRGDSEARVDSAYQASVPGAPDAESQRPVDAAGRNIVVYAHDPPPPDTRSRASASPDERADAVRRAHKLLVARLRPHAVQELGVDECGWFDPDVQARWHEDEVAAFLRHVKEPYSGGVPRGRFEAILAALSQLEAAHFPPKTLADCVFFWYNGYKTRAHPLVRAHIQAVAREELARNAAERRNTAEKVTRHALNFVRRVAKSPHGIASRASVVSGGQAALQVMGALASARWPSANQRNLAKPAWVDRDGMTVEEPTISNTSTVVHVPAESLPRRRRRRGALFEANEAAPKRQKDGDGSAPPPPQQPPPTPEPEPEPEPEMPLDPREAEVPKPTATGVPWYVPKGFAVVATPPDTCDALVGRHILYKWDPGEEGGWAVALVKQKSKAPKASKKNPDPLLYVVCAYRTEEGGDEHYRHGLDVGLYASRGDGRGACRPGSWCLLVSG